MNKWRPEGWKPDYKVTILETANTGDLASYTSVIVKSAFEAGADAILEKVCEEMEKALLTDGENPLASPLWRSLHDILIDWNEGRMKIERGGNFGTVVNLAKGENNIKAVKAMIEVVAQAQLDKILAPLRSEK